MLKILVFGHHSTVAWWRYVTSKLQGVREATLISDLKGDGDRFLMPAFYRHMADRDVEDEILPIIGNATRSDITARCRYLRGIDRALAGRIVCAMWKTLEETIAEEEPDLFLSARVDFFLLDIVQRILERRGIRYVGIWRSAVVPDHVFFTTRGEHIPLRNPDAAEIEAFVGRVGDSQFRATSLRRGRKFSFFEFAKKKLYHDTRAIFLDIQRHVLRNPLAYRYMCSGRHVPEYRVRLRDMRVQNTFAADWQERLRQAPFDRRVFIGLQVNPEATIDYYVSNLDLIQYENVLQLIVDRWTRAGLLLFVKDHPNMFGFRSRRFLEQLAAYPGVTLVPYDVPSQYLVDQCKTTFTWTGTIGLQAAMTGRCSVVVQPTYLIPEYFVQICGLDDIDATAAAIDRHDVSGNDLDIKRNRLAAHVLRTLTPGRMDWRWFSTADSRKVAGTESIIRSMNEHLPSFSR
jgi:hypothetical protein